MVVSGLPFLQTKSRLFHTTQSLVCPFMVSGGRISSHPKGFWNWSHDRLRNGACFSSVASRRAWAGKAEHRRRPAAAGWARSPRHSHGPLSPQPRPLYGPALLLASAGSCPGSAKCWRKQKMPQLPTLLKLSKARLASAVRRGSGEGETCPTISRHPVPPFLWGQGGSSRRAHAFCPAYPTLILEFCLH